MGNGAAQSGSQAEAGRADIYGGEQGHRSVARCAGENFLGYAIHRLSKISRTAGGPGVFLFRTLSDGALQDTVEQPLR